MKSKLRFNMLDVAVLLLAAALIATFFLRDTVIKAFERVTTTNIEFSYSVDALENDKAVAARDGTKLYDSESELLLGNIKSIEINANAVMHRVLDDGTVASVVNSDFSSLKGIATASVTKRSDGYYAENKLLIAKGCVFTVSDGFSQYTVRITNVTPLE